MKKLNDYILEQEINESKKWFQSLWKSAGKAMKNNIKNKFANKHPNWYKEFEALEKITDVEEAKKKIEKLLANVDNMPELKDDNAKAAGKLTTLITQKQTAEEAKNTDLVKWIDSKIEEMSKANPEATKQVDKEMKQAVEKENAGKGGEGGEAPVNPVASAVGQNKEEVKNVVDALDIDTSKLSDIARKVQTLGTGENKDEDYREYIKELYKDDTSEKEMNIALTTLFLAYEKLKDCAKNGNSKVNPDTMKALFSKYEGAKEADNKEVQQTAQQAAGQK